MLRSTATRLVCSARRAVVASRRRGFAAAPTSLRALVDHAANEDLAAAARRTHSEVSVRCEEQLARLAALEGLAGAGRGLSTLTALYKGVVAELAAGDELAASASGDNDLNHLHRSFKSIEERHALFVPSVVDALKDGAVPDGAASALEDCLSAHIGAATLLRNHLLAHAPEMENPGATLAAPPARGTGSARLAYDLAAVVGTAVGDAQLVCEHAYDLADPPPVAVSGEGAAACVPAHAVHVVRELLKNALVATIERHIESYGDVPDDWDEELPAVEVALGPTSIAVADAGGGLDQARLDACMEVRPGLSRYDRLDEPGGSYNSGSQTPISGVGMGLPLSKLYARHYGGALSLVSGDGGVTATLSLPADPDGGEALPGAPEAANTAWGRR